MVIVGGHLPVMLGQCFSMVNQQWIIQAERESGMAKDQVGQMFMHTFISWPGYSPEGPHPTREKIALLLWAVYRQKISIWPYQWSVCVCSIGSWVKHLFGKSAGVLNCLTKWSEYILSLVSLVAVDSCLLLSLYINKSRQAVTWHSNDAKNVTTYSIWEKTWKLFTLNRDIFYL